ncbi:MAG: transferase [Acidianus infernus]|uniref:transferase n=1 Tax=Acidianus infernus TaxID=12915 RepID=UPI002274D41C|nr:transferase [Acidianus infernus]
MPDGKIPLQAEVYLDGEKVEARVFLHVKGYKRARVTHIDVEGDKIKGLLRPRHSVYPLVEWKGNEVTFPINEHKIRMIIPEITLNFNGNLYVGGKGKGIFLGFHRNEIRQLEEIAKQKGVEPIGRGSKA